MLTMKTRVERIKDICIALIHQLRKKVEERLSGNQKRRKSRGGVTDKKMLERKS